MDIQQPWDVKALVASFKANGLDIAEDAAKLVVEQVLAFIEASVVLTPNKVDDLSIALIQAVKPFVMDQLDKIDGEKG